MASDLEGWLGIRCEADASTSVDLRDSTHRARVLGTCSRAYVVGSKPKKLTSPTADGHTHNFHQRLVGPMPLLALRRLKDMYRHQEDWLVQSVVTSVLADENPDSCIATIQAC